MKKESLIKRFLGWIYHRKWWLITILILVFGGISMFGDTKTQTDSQFATINLSRGDLRQVVTATGEIRPLNTISIGSQVSGIIQKIYVDYNSKVKKGDTLLTIDPTVLQASVEEVKASLVSAESQRNYAKNEFNRNKTLYSDGFIARAEMEQSQTTYEQAEQAVKRTKSQYDRAVTNLSYATIVSPVDGTVISRKVDKGQTVAASFQSPDMFEIAEDLSKMQIETSVSEADIGVIKEGQVVTFTVDAYPTQTFQGNVKQIRLSPTTTSNVVVYTVVIDVDNSDMRLMPGMTAFVTIVIAEKKDVLKASNSAFLLRSFDGIAGKPGDATPKTHMAIERIINGKTSIILIPYTKGLITSTETEVISDGLKESDKIITGVLGKAASSNIKMGPGSGNGVRNM
ncbi:MAG: efflux RND transporter periplasmic adaptor subunit [Alphaproteobacteria bacterium]|nr:efflux RND transporter periplasmic adaptor subunit [Alphaproteobacteria bacterium]MBN2675328.1 efflux RND transporter periplasmic adaptor subunit [Alphaproteobacteria bacterium]